MWQKILGSILLGFLLIYLILCGIVRDEEPDGAVLGKDEEEK